MKAVDYFLNGNSCSESIVLGAADKGWIDDDILALATPFSGGLSSGCLCGAVSGSMLVIGYLYGKKNKFNNPVIARELAKKFMKSFKDVHKATCCRVLSRGTEPGTPERKQHCTNFVEYAFKTLEIVLQEAGNMVKNG